MYQGTEIQFGGQKYLPGETFVAMIIFCLALNTAWSQIPVGLKYDVNGMPFNGYFDPLIYSPAKRLSLVHNPDSYELGCYFDKLGNKTEGLIKYENDAIFFKKGDKEEKEKIRPGDIQCLVIGTDSFIVISDFRPQYRIKKGPEH